MLFFSSGGSNHLIGLSVEELGIAIHTLVRVNPMHEDRGTTVSMPCLDELLWFLLLIVRPWISSTSEIGIIARL